MMSLKQRVFLVVFMLIGSFSLLINHYHYQYQFHPAISSNYDMIIRTEIDNRSIRQRESVLENKLNSSIIQSQRIRRLEKECHSHKPQVPRGNFQSKFHLFLLDPQTGLAYCHVPKVASSFWYSIFSTIVPGVPKNLTLPTLHSTMLDLSRRAEELPENAFKMIFVRHPLKRLVSAYVEKFVKTQEKNFIQPLKEFIRNQNAETLEINFPIFIKFVIHEMQRYRLSYGTHHWIPYTSLCQICQTRLDFIGHLETLNEDAELLIELFPKLKKFIPTKRNNISDQTLHNTALHNDPNQTQNYFSQLDNKTRQDLLLIYKLDCSIFGYDCNEFW
ncbi:carbohydrate sulfotransferase 12-like isoform X2 [Tigriopus californicus]|nr:carbohydrate sulfotransferase 12-like isoform X2 [Tigriopus californicus]XP_059094270.1 carbohydrate sulfotransferase 12-like isoform X2 [Tigriopus californicus]